MAYYKTLRINTDILLIRQVSSIFGKQPGGLVDYDVIKAAVIMFTKDLSNYLAKNNILVNAICPGPIRTPLWEGPGQLGDQLGQTILLIPPSSHQYKCPGSRYPGCYKNVSAQPVLRYSFCLQALIPAV
ncbi:MAG: SDR family oxidoreductase [Desulfobacterales bacterium]|nr:SDR family oxidoreductase [Desulfobacterales bacterium]